MTYSIAIPSHRRDALFEEKTLAYLRESDVALDRVTLFLSDDEDAAAYARLGLETVVTGAANLTSKFNFIHSWYDPGTNVFVMEDDVKLVEAVVPKTNQKRQLTQLDAFLDMAFGCIKDGGIWGVAPHSNTFYFSGKITHTLKLVVAHAFGFVSTRDSDLEVRLPSKTDYERTCRYFMRYGAVVRMDMVGAHTNSYTQPGGMQSDHTRDERAALERQSCDALVAEFPHLVAHKEKKTSPFAELRFKSIR